MRKTPFRRLAAWLVPMLLLAPGADRASGQTARTPTERMAPARLKAAHEDAQRIRQSRRALAPIPGWNDYRAILHAHADDSAHTGGTRTEMLADAKRARVDAILLSDHHRPPRDFINESWRGLRQGVLFVPGSEARGFLILPSRSIMDRMDEPTPAFIETVRADGGLIFLSHVEERPDHSMAGLDGMEIYNRHADAKKDRAGILAIFMKLTDPAALQELEESLRLYPDEILAAQVTSLSDYLVKWDAETKTRRLTGVAANDCHHNQVLLVKMVDRDTVRLGTNVDRDEQMRTVTVAVRPGIRTLTEGKKPGDILARLDFDPYHRSFLNSSTHILAPELSEAAIRAALREGHAYVSHDWMCDPTGFQFTLRGISLSPPRVVVMGDELTFAAGGTLEATFPASCKIRLLDQGRVVAERTSDHLEHAVTSPGVYRVEARLIIDGEERPWIYSNPIYVR